MPSWIPERPTYKKEHRTVGFMALAAFLLLFLCRFLTPYLPLDGMPWLTPLLWAGVSLFLPVLCYMMFRGRGYRQALRLQMPRGAHTPLLIAAFFALFSGSLLLSILCGGTETLGNSVAVFDTASTKTVWETLLWLLTSAALPALLEELFFRGIVAVEYERRGAFRAILMSALLFALLRFDLSNLLAYFFAGVLLALVLYATNSLLATMLLHVLYSIAARMTQQYLNALYHFTGTVQLFLFIFVLMLLVSLILFCRTCARIYRVRDEQGIGNPRRDVPYNVQFYTVLDAISDPAIIAAVGVAIAGFIVF